MTWNECLFKKEKHAKINHFEMIGRIEGEEMLLFNLSALSGSEEIGSVELHFYKRRQQRRHHYYLQGFSVGEGARLTPIGKWQVEQDRRGWMVYDVTQTVHQWKESRVHGNVKQRHKKGDNHHVGFMFQMVKRSSDLVYGDDTVSIDSVVRMDPSPFLIIFSNELSNATLDHVGSMMSHDVEASSLNALPDSDAIE